MTEPSDAELWSRMRGGDADAVGDLFTRHGPLVHRFALRRTGDHHAADDVTAIVFLEMWRRREVVELRQPSALPWLYGVAANVVANRRRSERRHRDALERLRSLPPLVDRPTELQVEAATEARSLLGGVASVPRRELDVLVLSVWEGLSLAEVAAALQIPIGTVKSRLARARARIASNPTGVSLQFRPNAMPKEQR